MSKIMIVVRQYYRLIHKLYLALRCLDYNKIIKSRIYNLASIKSFKKLVQPTTKRQRVLLRSALRRVIHIMRLARPKTRNPKESSTRLQIKTKLIWTPSSNDFVIRNSSLNLNLRALVCKIHMNKTCKYSKMIHRVRELSENLTEGVQAMSGPIKNVDVHSGLFPKTINIDIQIHPRCFKH